ncbi:hypothetical protein EHS13_29945 [Paenibacillus psychroresistens]|uniref:Uncharacterized protein n=1 Tax=Paenibacillus psychroresistens TaxID=1778678 RepID=A0A6B8RS73_9BACL|nr:hypothetical protein [Paenibacillus psychroresistens]QGQ98799.1 hypothetical protein EHS13_29945 [Paenibacillus psychroresistens]
MIKTYAWTLFFVILLAGVYVWNHSNTGLDPVIKSIIKNYQGIDGRIQDDSMGSLGLKTIDDIGFRKKESILEVWYGKQIFKANIKNKEVMEALIKLDLTVAFDPLGNVLLMYKGEVVKEYE